MTIETLYQQMLAAMGPGTGSKPESHLPRRLGRFSGAYSRSEYQLAQRGLRTG